MKILSKFFLSPNYLNIPCFGVYISDTSIKYVQIDSNGFFDNLGKFGVINLEEGLVVNGEIKNPIKIIEILRELKNREKINFARIGIQDNKVFQYTIDVSIEKIKNIQQIVEASVEEYAKSSFKNFEMDYEIVESNMKNITVLVFVSKKSKGIITVSKDNINKIYFNVTDANGCINLSDTVEIKNTTSISSVDLKSSIKIYPNPTKNLVFIDAPIKVNVKLTDITGHLIMEIKEAKQINLENFAEGNYILMIANQDGNLISIEKISKMP